MKSAELFILICSSIYAIIYIIKIFAVLKYKNNKKLLYIFLRLLPFILLIVIVFSTWLNLSLFKFEFFNVVGILWFNPQILAKITFIGQLII